MEIASSPLRLRAMTPFAWGSIDLRQCERPRHEEKGLEIGRPAGGYSIFEDASS